MPKKAVDYLDKAKIEITKQSNELFLRTRSLIKLLEFKNLIDTVVDKYDWNLELDSDDKQKYDELSEQIRQCLNRDKTLTKHVINGASGHLSGGSQSDSGSEESNQEQSDDSNDSDDDNSANNQQKQIKLESDFNECTKRFLIDLDRQEQKEQKEKQLKQQQNSSQSEDSSNSISETEDIRTETKPVPEKIRSFEKDPSLEKDPNFVEAEYNSSEIDSNSTEEIQVKKRGRGRPKKNTLLNHPTHAQTSIKKEHSTSSSAHHSGTFFTCMFQGCGKKFQTERCRKIHSITHNQSLLVCTHNGCNKAFKYKKAYEKHQAQHFVAGKEYWCDWPQCEYTSMNLEEFKAHKSAHKSETKPDKYHCDRPGCGQRFQKKSLLKIHLETHQIMQQRHQHHPKSEPIREPIREPKSEPKQHQQNPSVKPNKDSWFVCSGCKFVSKLYKKLQKHQMSCEGLKSLAANQLVSMGQ